MLSKRLSRRFYDPGYAAASQIRLDIGRTRYTSCTVKGVSMLGTWCEFMVDFAIPEYMRLGKSVSRGFGAVVRMKR